MIGLAASVNVQSLFGTFMIESFSLKSIYKYVNISIYTILFKNIEILNIRST